MITAKKVVRLRYYFFDLDTITEAARAAQDRHQWRMAEHCTQLGLPAREDYIFVAKALSQVSHDHRYDIDTILTKYRDIDIHNDTVSK